MPILAGVDVRIVRGESVAVTGPSGSGKSTLMAVLGLLTTRSAGIFAPRRTPGTGRRTRLGAVRADGRAWRLGPADPLVLPGRSALDNVLLGSRFRSRLGHVLARAVLALSRSVSAMLPTGTPPPSPVGSSSASGWPEPWSQGARVVMADEPTASLDHASTLRVVEALRAVRGRATLLVATHDPVVAGACDRVLVLRDGRLVVGS